MPRTLNPMDGCPDCKWIGSNYGRHLDPDGVCDLHQKIGALQEDLAMERDIRQSHDNLIKEICEAIGASEDDDPAKLARERMEEIRTLEDELAKYEAAGGHNPSV